MDRPKIEEVISAVLGKIAWGVKQGYGSFLTFEFGDPHLRIREPGSISTDASETVRKHCSRRILTVCGDWHLRIFCCGLD